MGKNIQYKRSVYFKLSDVVVRKNYNYAEISLNGEIYYTRDPNIINFLRCVKGKEEVFENSNFYIEFCFIDGKLLFKQIKCAV